VKPTKFLTIVPVIQALGRSADRILPATILVGPWRASPPWHLDIGVPAEACPLDLAPHRQHDWRRSPVGDALAVALLKARGFTEEDFVPLGHPAGSLGAPAAAARQGRLVRVGADVPKVAARRRCSPTASWK